MHSLTLVHEVLDNYLLCRAAGQWTRDEAERIIEEIAELATNQGYDRVLVDAQKLSAPQMELDRYLAGKHIAMEWHRLKVAIIYPQDQINKFTENTAVNRGALLIVVSEFGDAENWLLNRTG